MSTTASKHMGLWGGHVGHVCLVWLDGYVGIQGGVNIGVNLGMGPNL